MSDYNTKELTESIVNYLKDNFPDASDWKLKSKREFGLGPIALTEIDTVIGIEKESYDILVRKISSSGHRKCYDNGGCFDYEISVTPREASYTQPLVSVREHIIPENDTRNPESFGIKDIFEGINEQFLKKKEKHLKNLLNLKTGD